MRSDEQLLQAWQRGEVSAFDALYARYEAPLFGFIRRMLDGQRAEAEDVLHETFIAVLRVRDVRQLKALLYETARRACFNRMRSQRRSDAAMEKVTVLPDGELADVQLISAQNAKALQVALRVLPTALVEAFSLRASGLSYEEMAKVMDVPVGTVKSRLHESVKRLREELKS